MFQFPRFASLPMDSVHDSVSKHTGFPHSEIAGYNGSYHLTDAYRRLARPLIASDCQGIHRVRLVA